MCTNCERFADQRDGALKLAQAATAEALEWRAKYAEARETAADALVDRDLLLGENAELRAQVEDRDRTAQAV